MVSISNETVMQTELRLRRVIEKSELHFMEGEFAFHESPEADFGPSVLAVVRDGNVWSRLEPAAPSDEERFAIWSCYFPDGVDNSGFVGWLASRLKSRLGTGVFVICGHNPDRGGIFDYWGVPTEVAEEALREVRCLAYGPGAVASAPSLDGVVMCVTENSPASVISNDTVFRFQQSGEVVQGQYEGGQVMAGSLVGILQGEALKFCFSQLEAGDKYQTGVSECDLVRREGKLVLVERFEWTDSSRPSGRNVLREI